MKNAKNRQKLVPAISQQPIIRFFLDFACNTRFIWANWHEAVFVSDCCLPDRISKRRYISRPNIQILAILGMQKKVTPGPSLWLDSVFWRLSTRQEIEILSYLGKPKAVCGETIYIGSRDISFFDILSSRQLLLTKKASCHLAQVTFVLCVKSQGNLNIGCWDIAGPNLAYFGPVFGHFHTHVIFRKISCNDKKYSYGAEKSYGEIKIGGKILFGNMNFFGYLGEF